MEYILSHTSYTSDASGQPERRMRPQSAFVPSQSYYKQKDADDDVGRPVLQHKPLAKGEFTQFSLAKVFEDDPGMRPKVFAPQTVNKVSYGLMSHDISGAAPLMKAAPNKARDTDPNTPRYVLPGSSSIPAAVAAAVAAAAADGAIANDPALPTTQIPPQQPPPQQQQQQPQQPQQRLQTRDTLNVADINTVASVTERPNRIETRDTQFNTRDVEGSWPGWEPHFRKHVGKNLRDPGLDVSDISGTFRRRRVFSARPHMGTSRDSRGGSGAAGACGAAVAAAAAAAAAAPPPPAPQVPALAVAAAAVARDEQQQQQQPAQRRQLQSSRSYLPPPILWQSASAVDPAGRQHRSSGSEGSSSGGGGSGATRRHSHPVGHPPAPKQQQQAEQQQPTPLEQPQDSSAAHAAGAWPTSVSLPLRPSLSPPPFATYIPTGSVAAVLSASLDASTASRTAVVADHPSVTVGKPTPCKRDPRARHSAKLTLAEVQRADAAEAQRVISSLRPSRETVEEFFTSCRRLDRETCGKVAPTDFMHALERANLLSEVSEQGVDPAAAAVSLARGLQDGCGMVSYRYLAKALLGQTSTPAATRRASLTAVPTAAAAAPAVAPQQPSAATSAPPPAPKQSLEAAAAVAPVTNSAEPAAAATASALVPTPFATAATAAGNALRRTLSRQTSDVQAGGGVWRNAATTDGSTGQASGTYDDAVAAAAAAAAATSRRSVNFAPEPSGADDGDDGGLAAATTAPPPTPPPAQELKRLERQERQIRREGSQRRRPASAMPGGGGGGPKGAGTVAAVFKLLGAQQPILYDTPAPASAAAQMAPTPTAPTSIQPYAGSGASIAVTRHSQTKAGSPPPEAAAAAATATAADGAAAAAHDGMGFGPHWPPEPHPGSLQKRSASAIMETGNFQLRDVCDVTYFPYKAHALWFSGRAPVGPDGTEAPGGPSEAAREYQPSVDPLSMIVGKGHHRINVAPSGHKLEPEVEAAIVARLRPQPGLGSSPEATARARTAASVVQQLQVDNPLMFSGNVDPTTPAGAALKGMLGCLYTTNSSGGGAASLRASVGGAVRPSTAGTRRGMHTRSASVSKSMATFPGGGGGAAAAAGGGGSSGGVVRVGRAALERQMHREEVAAVRRLC